MSLATAVDIIEKALLSDGWHLVADASFHVDTYEYVHGGRAVRSAAQVEGLTSTVRSGANRAARATDCSGCRLLCLAAQILSGNSLCEQPEPQSSGRTETHQARS
jgi:hypothetical protein